MMAPCPGPDARSPPRLPPCYSALAELAPNFTAMVMPNVEAAVQHWRALAAR